MEKHEHGWSNINVCLQHVLTVGKVDTLIKEETMKMGQ